MARRRHGQGLIEYIVLITVVIAALIAMMIYVKRGISGRMRASADSLGEQYDPRKTTSNLTMAVNSDVTTTSTLIRDVCFDAKGKPQLDQNGDPVKNCSSPTKADIMATTTKIGNYTTSRDGTETVDSMGNNLWQ